MNFDLNVSNYNIDELMQLFNLPKEYSELDVTDQQTIMEEKIQYDKKLSGGEKTNIRDFIKTVGLILIDGIKQQQESQLPITKSNNRNKMIYEDSHQEVQRQSISPYIPAYPSNVYAGIMNPLKRRTITRTVNIDTRFRQKYYPVSTNYRFELPMILNKVVSIQLKTFEFPSFAFNISQDFGNNYFSVNGKLFYVPDGCYPTATTLVDAINEVLQEENATITFSVSNVNQKVSIQGFMNESIVVDFETEKDSQLPLALKMGWVLGFRDTKYTANVVAEAMPDMATLKYFYLCLNDFNNNTVNNTFVGALKESLLDQNILARISLQTSALSTLSSSLICPIREYFGPVTINAFQLQLVDAYGRILNLHNLDYSFCLAFEMVYDL
jgi:hypothetical protein